MKVILQRFQDLVLRNPASWKWVLGLAFVFRLGFLFASGQWKTEEYWEYGQIAQLLLDGKGYSFPFVDENLNFLKNAWYPSALMPPGYVFVLMPFLLIQDLVFRNILFFGLQIGVSLAAMLFFFQFVKEKAGYPVALLTLLFQAFTPDLIFASVSVGPTVWFHFLFSLFFWSEMRCKGNRGLYLQIFSAGILVLMRSEVLLFFGLYAAIYVWKGMYQQALGLMLGIGLMLAPWLYRNVQQFGKPMLSASVGVNFYRGNNPGSIGDWPPVFNTETLKMRQNPKTFETHYDGYALQLSKAWIQENPVVWLGRLPEKLARFWIIDWPDPRTHTPYYWLPWFFTLIIGIVGLRTKDAVRRFKGPFFLMVVYTMVILIFFPQLRYLTLIKFFWMPFAGLGCFHLMELLTIPKQNREGREG